MTRQCANCSHTGLVELQMTVKSGHELTMLSCSRCEARTWLVDEQPVDRDEVLKITSGDPDFVVQPSAGRARRAPTLP